MPNRLSTETSPYLLQHAHNPVDWWAYTHEAFEAAKSQDKPILVSIGYSTCHWCHVMERDAFEVEPVAAYMNAHFINIKVDREERPDVDDIYMDAIQAMGVSGGWPLNCFLLPDGRPFYGGTYYPPEPNYGRPSWVQILQGVVNAYKHRRDTVVEQAERLTQQLTRNDESFEERLLGNTPASPVLSPATLMLTYQTLQSSMDREYGGFGGAPKFPSTMALRWLLYFDLYYDQPGARAHVERSLDHMIFNGLYDPLAGGFARYTTDRAWRIPHFEKMLYDNALLCSLLAESYRAYGKPLYAEALRQTLDFVMHDMQSPTGGFYSAYDADSEGVEGLYYLWTTDEIRSLLPTEQAAYLIDYYQMTDEGNWESRNILWRQPNETAFLERHRLDADNWQHIRREAHSTLLDYRRQRVAPHLDDKILLNWNALMVTALIAGYHALGDTVYLECARRNLDFLLRRLRRSQHGYYHTYKEGTAKYAAYLDDYAYLAEACIALYQATLEEKYLLQAVTLIDYVFEHFADPTHPLFYYTEADQPDLILRKKDRYDNATPSGNATLLHVLQQLYLLIGDPRYRSHTDAMAQAMSAVATQHPLSFGRWASYYLLSTYGWQSIAITDDDAYEQATRLQHERLLPHAVVAASSSSATQVALLRGRYQGGTTTFYLCKDLQCDLPVHTLEELTARL